MHLVYQPLHLLARFDPPSRQHFDFNFVNRNFVFVYHVTMLVLVSKLKWQRRYLRFS